MLLPTLFPGFPSLTQPGGEVGFLLPALTPSGKRQLGLLRPETIQHAIRRTVEPITHMSGQLAGNLHHLGRAGLGLVPGTDPPDLDAAFLHLPRARGKLR